ncbi:hypothetical protein PHLGIDRAFT_420878 [Phlebiopsis gigantea 11061_1 CR5-6]|uniref:Uncharacterized protein n=1 Tax=Phlebiopsis gigantea (strain 11061_1 CR5-6) TaxID=745531 RepID=A0A0C3S8I3_PHLG1|nr:hypothetical protein PHLGIDRAFT_420878 [Phlebiopsis gigantea 11061_1 CR5-6]
MWISQLLSQPGPTLAADITDCRSVPLQTRHCILRRQSSDIVIPRQVNMPSEPSAFFFFLNCIQRGGRIAPTCNTDPPSAPTSSGIAKGDRACRIRPWPSRATAHAFRLPVSRRCVITWAITSTTAPYVDPAHRWPASRPDGSASSDPNSAAPPQHAHRAGRYPERARGARSSISDLYLTNDNGWPLCAASLRATTPSRWDGTVVACPDATAAHDAYDAVSGAPQLCAGSTARERSSPCPGTRLPPGCPPIGASLSHC